MALEFDTSFDPAYGRAVTVAPDVLRVTARNPSPFTFHGTNSYLVGRDTLAVIDPGPEDDAHLETLLTAIGGRPVSHIFVSHTHRDHSPLAARLKEHTGAPTLAEGPHRPARPLRIGEVNPLDASADLAFVPDVVLADNALTQGDGWAIRTVLTPGHTANHAVFALEGTGTLFSADHVMAWSTSIVAPPDGAMGDYMTSLQKLLGRAEQRYFPGHGGPVGQPQAFLRALIAHRRMREASILKALAAGDGTISAIVARVYEGLRPELVGAAALNTLAHLEDLCARGVARTDGAPAMDGRFAVAG